MKKVYVVLTLVVVLLFGGTFALHGVKVYFVNKVFSKPMVQVQTVSTAKVTQQDWQPYLHAVGSVVANRGVDVSPRSAGVVSSILFKSGQQVKKGQLLVQLDDAMDQQVLASDLVTLHLNQLAYKRKVEIANATPSVSQSDLEASAAQVQIQQNKVAQDKLNIEHKKVVAPFAGRVGIRQVNLGQYLQPGASVVTLQDLHIAHVDFNLAQADVSKVQVGQKVALRSGQPTGQAFDGSITAISPLLDVNTRTVKVRASFANPKGELLPGQFVTLGVYLPIARNVLTVPMTAITYTLFGNTVYVVSPKEGNDKSLYLARSTQVDVGARRDNLAVINHGLKKGDQIVISGQLKLQNGSTVKINNLKQ